MGCGCNKGGGGSSKETKTEIKTASPMNVLKNLAEAASKQPSKIKWIKEGAKGILKALGEKSIYSDEQIQSNRDICRDCEHSTKNNGKLTATSQCMYPDPAKDGAPCGCLILLKTQSDKCPANKWTPLTLNNSPQTPN